MQQGLQSFSLGVKGPDIRLRQPLRPCRVKDRPFIASTDLGQGKPEKEQLTQNALSRRSAILLTSISLLSASNFVAKESLASSQGQQLPANYVKFARRLLSALRDSLEAELSPANETEVRRKAEPAKKLVKEWVTDWRDARNVAQEVSYKRITVADGIAVSPTAQILTEVHSSAESLQLLGDFYLKKGQRARLPPDLGSRILRLLSDASAALPA